MSNQSGYLKKKARDEDNMLAAGMQAGQQMASDMYDVILNDPDVMGKSVIGHERMLKIRAAVEEALTYYAPAYDIRHPEADVYQEKLDNKLRRVWKELLVPFEKRYPMFKKIRYGKKNGGGSR